MNKLESFKAFEVEKEMLKKVSGGLRECQYYENRCMQTAQKEGNLFLLDDCDALCDSNGDWN